MEYVLAVFVNRSHSQLFSKLLLSKGIPANVISTPRDLGLSCGLSVKFNLAHLGIAKNLLKSSGFTSFKNFYKEMHLGYNKYNYIKV
jgi:hypothetical protein